jgi:hypothetical protein
MVAFAFGLGWSQPVAYRSQRKIGELAMDLDIAKVLIEEVDRRPRSPTR